MSRSIPNCPPPPAKPKRKRVQVDTGTKTPVEQQHRAQVNINTIMRKLHAQGTLPPFQTGATYGDFSNAEDYQSCQERILKARSDFMCLPSELRTRFENKPENLIRFLEDPENLAECRELGLIAPEGYLDSHIQQTPVEAAEPPKPETPTEPLSGASA